MKKLIIYILLVTTLSGVLTPLTYVEAQTGNPADLGTCQLPPPFNTVAANQTKDQCDGVGGTWTPNSANTPARISADQQQTIETGACPKSIWNLVGADLLKCSYQLIANFIYGLVLFPFATLLGLAGTGLDAVITYTILQMADKISGPNAFTGINIAWKLIRDLMNIFFIFILVYEAILLILGMSSTENIGKFIGYLVLAALLVNFSLFFTKILIDASNVVTIGIYNNIIQSSSSVTILGRPIGGISVPFMANLGLGKIFANESVSAMFDGPLNMILGMLMGAIFMFIAAIIFIVISIMFIIRYITLLLLLMLSPIGFMGSALSFMRDPAKKWWSALNSQLIFPPVYMLLTWVVLTLMQSEGFIRASNAWDAQSYVDNKITFVMNFIVIIILLIATLIISKDISTKGSNYIKNATGKMSAFAGGAIIAGGASLARNTIGRRYDRLAQDQQLKDRAAKGDVGAQARLATYRSIASTNFDAKNAFKAVGIDLGKATNKDGYRGAVTAKADREEKYAKSLKMSDYEKAQAKAKLDEYRKNEKSKEMEEEAKKTEFDANADIQKEFAEKREAHEKKIKEEEAKIKKVEEEVTATAKADIEKLEGNLQSADRELVELKQKLSNVDMMTVDFAETSALREKIQQKEKDRQSIASEIQTKKDTVASTVAQGVKTATQKNQQVIEDANKNLANIQDEYGARRKAYISKEQRDLIARAGGQEELKDKKGNIIQEKVETHDTARIEEYAGYFDKRSQNAQAVVDSADDRNFIGKHTVGYAEKLYGRVRYGGTGTSINLETASKIRSISKKKTAAQLVKELTEATGETQASSATPTPAPQATVTPANDAGAGGGTTA